MAKKIIFGEEARAALKKGIDTVANAVKLTIGPRGRNVVLDKGYGTPTTTNDGVLIAMGIFLKDKFENMGAEIIKEVAGKTNEVSGDGTSTSVVLAQAMISEGMKHTTIGVNSMAIKAGMEIAGKEVVATLKQISKPIKTKAEIRQVATISAESEEMGIIIADAIDTVGLEGVVTVEESQSFGVVSEVVQGLQFDKGYVSPYLVTNRDRMEAEYAEAQILITDKTITSIQDILPLLEKIVATGKKEIVIIAEEFQSEVLSMMIVNRLRGGFNALAIKAPAYGEKRKDLLQDIALTVGATVISEDVGLSFEGVTLAMLGHASKVISTRDTTTIVGGKGDKKEIEARLKELKSQRKLANAKFDQEKLDERISKLSGGVAVIKVGAATETEMKYLKLKIEDAVNATKAAIEEGIVPGGGSALIRVIKKISSKKVKPLGAIGIGFDLVIKSLESPLKQIAINSGKDDGAVIVEKILNSAKDNAGYDAFNDVFVDDMLKAGIIDPVKVTRSAVQNALSAASIFLTTEVAISEDPDEKKHISGNAGMDMGY